MTRSKSRELLMQCIFQMEARGSADLELVDLVIRDEGTGSRDEEYIKTNFLNIVKNKDEIDKKIDERATRWNTKRMPKTDLAIARLAVGETLYGDTPAAVAIDEAVELAKKFAGDDSPKFINGLLGQVIG